jgi:hypothetical protein
VNGAPGRGGLAALTALVVARLAFHAVYLPAFEGPDEPHHLARIRAFATEPIAVAFREARVDGTTIGAVRAHPCSDALHRAYGCARFGQSPAAFDLLRAAPRCVAADPVRNPEANQPPLYYLLAGLGFRLLSNLRLPEAMLLATRLLAAGLVAIALVGPLRVLARSRPPAFAVGGLLALLLPGASEALVRCSNDAPVFLWCALAVAAIERRSPALPTVALLAAGPLLKLTAIPVVVFGVAALWLDRRRVASIAAAGASLLVFPVQWLRGWRWGGTVELNWVPEASAEGAAATLRGLFRSLYVFVKTTFWVGGWSFFRAPRVLVAAFAVLLLFALFAARPRSGAGRSAHLLGLGASLVGWVAFALANHRFYGVWGGIGGWYFWDWAPWLFVAAADLAMVPARTGRVLVGALAVFVVASNVAWFVVAAGVYG